MCLGIVTGVVGLIDEQGGNTLPEQASYQYRSTCGQAALDSCKDMFKLSLHSISQ